MSKLTAVEWLMKKMPIEILLECHEEFYKAIIMEREQIEKAYIQGCWDEIDERMESCVEESCKMYYINTYKGGEQ